MNHISITTSILRRWTAGVAVFVALAACGDDAGTDADNGGESAPETSDAAEPEETTTPDGLPPEEQEVLDAYQDAWDAVIAAYDPADPEHPDLLATFAGQALVNHQSLLANLQMEGVSEVATSSEHDPDVASLVADTAVVVDCLDQVVETLDSETREQAGEPRDVNLRMESTLEKRDGTWLVVGAESVEDGTC